VIFSIVISFDISKLFFKLASSKLHMKYERISIGIISLHIYFKTLLKAKGRNFKILKMLLAMLFLYL
jgi:hypothetical protein